MPRLQSLSLSGAAIGDAGLAALAPALRRRPALEELHLCGNPFGDEGLAALVAPPPADAPPPAAASPPPAGGLKKLNELNLDGTQVSDVGCATLAAALNRGALPALEHVELGDMFGELDFGIPASDEAIEAVFEALARSRAAALAKAAGPLGAG